MKQEAMVSLAEIDRRIFTLRGQRVMLDHDLADLYGVSTRELVQAVKRNQERFPEDFLSQLTAEEYAALRSQFVISNIRPGRGGRRYLPFAFTEQGVAMLSSVLRSPRAIRVNVEIMRAFVRLRGATAVREELGQRLSDLERKYDTHEVQLKAVFDAIRKLMALPENPRRSIGFKVEEPRPRYGRPRRRGKS
jgi:hypothetical protein